MSKIDDGGLAFPGTRCQQVGTVAVHGFANDDTPTYADVHHSGMSLHNWFAGQALAGLCANSGGPFQANALNGWDIVNCDPSHVANWCHNLADAMVERAKGGAS